MQDPRSASPEADAGPLPHVLVLGTGGTIAGVAPSANTATGAGYTAGVLGVDQLLASAPGVQQQARLEFTQLCNIDSKDAGPDLWLDLARAVRAWRERPGSAGCVITHGSDTLEESAYALDCLLEPGSPVVLTAAMLPAAALSADGPRNLFDAVRVAGDPAAAGRGVLCVAHGRVHAARDVSKQHPARIDAFGSGERGPLGFIGAGGLRFTREQPGGAQPAFAFRSLPARDASWPRVELVCSHAGADGEMVRALLAASASGTLRPKLHGLVVLGTGGGTVHEQLQAALDQAVEAGVRVQVVPRTGPCEGGEFDGLNAAKVRVRLLLEALHASLQDEQAREPWPRHPAAAEPGSGGTQ